MTENMAGRGEGLSEAIERVKLMAMGDPQWDLSENDRKALTLLLAALEAAAPLGTVQAGHDFEQLVWRANDLLDRAKEAVECDPEADNVGGDCWTWIKQAEIWLEELNRGAALATPSPQPSASLIPSAEEIWNNYVEAECSCSGADKCSLHERFDKCLEDRNLCGYEGILANFLAARDIAFSDGAEAARIDIEHPVPAATQQPAGSAPRWNIEQILVYIWQCIGGEDSDPKEYPYSQFAESEGGKMLRSQMEGLGGSPRKVGEDAPEQLMTATGPVSLADFSRNLADDIYAISDGAAPDRETLRAMIRARLEVGLKYWKWERAVLGRSSSVPVGDQKQEEGV